MAVRQGMSSAEVRLKADHERWTLFGTTGVGGRDVLEDEQLLAGLDEAELAAGEILDRRRVFLQTAGLLAQARVLGAHVGKRLLERPILLTLLQHLQQSLFADQRVEDEHAPDEHEQRTARPAGRGGAWSDCSRWRLKSRFFTLLSTGTLAAFLEGSWQNSAFRSRVQLLSNTRDRKVQEKNVSQTPASTVAIVLTTLGADADAATLARTLVEERLAACVNMLPPMTSVYRWQGKVEQDREQQMVIKTTADRVAALQTRLRQLHPYELPEFLVLDAERVGGLSGLGGGVGA